MTQRLFLALWPPAAVLEELQQALPGGFPELRWQPRRRWHITVAFLGDRDEDRQLRRLDQLQPPAAGPVHLAGAGRFGPVLWVGVRAGAWLPSLAHATQRLFEVQQRRFHPHVTVARARTPAARARALAAQETLADFASQPWVPHELLLVRSTVGPEPAYEPMGRCPLRPA